jgi:hypothetical protein
MTTRRVVALSAAAVVAGGCTSVLGLDAPTLDPCIQHACLDAAVDGGVTVDAPGTDSVSPLADSGEASSDSSSDGKGGDGPSSEAAACVWDGGIAFDGGGVRCGGGCFPTVTCAGPTPFCCQTLGTGGFAYACVASESTCSGYSISCVNENDCGGSDVCCHYSTHTVCASSCTSNGDIACVPGSADDCPAGKSCSVRVTDGDAAAPYYTCQP